jgi:ribose transport system ATP-binding protein
MYDARTGVVRSFEDTERSQAEGARMSIAQQQINALRKRSALTRSWLSWTKPTSTLTDQETRLLFQIIRDLRSQHRSIIFITHRLDEIIEIADRVTVLRTLHDRTKEISETSKRELIAMMIGREMTKQFPPRDVKIATNCFVWKMFPTGKK